ncbi:MAG: hypothetical protein ACAI35_14465 [Candidatus Methylacidiphilales bacterium]
MADTAREPLQIGPWERVRRELYVNRWLLLFMFVATIVGVIVFIMEWRMGKDGSAVGKQAIWAFVFAILLMQRGFVAPAILYWHGTRHPVAAGFQSEWSKAPGAGADVGPEVLTVQFSTFPQAVTRYFSLQGVLPVLCIVVGVIIETAAGQFRLQSVFSYAILAILLLATRYLNIPRKPPQLTLDFSRGLALVEQPDVPRFFSPFRQIPLKIQLVSIARFEAGHKGMSSAWTSIQQYAHLNAVLLDGKKESLHIFASEGCDPVRVQDLAAWLTIQLDQRRECTPPASHDEIEINELDVAIAHSEYIRRVAKKMGIPLTPLHQENEAERIEVLKLRAEESMNAGRDIGWDRALQLWVRNHRTTWKAARLPVGEKF